MILQYACNILLSQYFQIGILANIITVLANNLTVGKMPYRSFSHWHAHILVATKCEEGILREKVTFKITRSLIFCH